MIIMYRVDENAPQGTALTFVDPYVPRVYDDDTGKMYNILIRVRDNILLDYEERHSVEFQILAQELGPATIFHDSARKYDYWNKVVQVKATDVDSMDLDGHVRYTAILGYLNTSLNLDAETGLIQYPPVTMEARDNDGTGNRAQVPLVIKLIDVNDESPIFEKDLRTGAVQHDLYRIYPPESLTRTVTFVVPGENLKKTKTEEILSTITGGKVIIHDIRPLQPDEPGAKTITGGNADSMERSVVTATVLYDSTSVVDISQIQHRLSLHNSSYAIMNNMIQKKLT
ncbi:unnamed protein product [Ceratitis capitata]|uniref:(Mediterranean fruit fly) hypothetical protein n=1 Tax=Ceratitis capitata TaxID=7213 RepID=A0A811UA04_CERCA|nr:unnamed protein product [Ceratitis capitata]